MTTAYPLSWPDAFPRASKREGGQFKTTLAGALKNVQDSLRRFAVDSKTPLENVVISSNVTLGANVPADPGVAIWFRWGDMPVCIAVDRYTRVEANLQAIHHIIEARRVELRHGTLALVQATFRGFLALPSQTNRKPWHEVLAVNPDTQRPAVEANYKTLRARWHPDRDGGDAERFHEIQQAWEEAQAVLR